MNRSKYFFQSSFVVLILGVCMIWTTSGFGATILVPYDYPTLQAGLDAASPGDTVLVTIGFTTFPDGTPIYGNINHETHIFDQFRPFGVIFPNLYPGYLAPIVKYNPAAASNDITRFGLLISGGPTGFFGDTELAFVAPPLPNFITIEIIGSGLNIGASLTAFNAAGALLNSVSHFYYGSTGIKSAFTLIAPEGETIATAIYNGGLNPNAAASIDNLMLGFVLPTLEITIDIKPGSDSNSIDPRSKGVIPVAILTTDTFDATTVDPLSVKFGPTGATEAHERGHREDVNGDGREDLVLHFRTQDTGIMCHDTSASLTGATLSGQVIYGSNSIRTVGCK